jgi:YidC/Oxa1 family membrane protein insertase
MTDPNIFNTLLIWPITNVLLVIYQLFAHAGLPFALGFSLIGLTIVIRLLLYPVISSQLKTAKKMQDLNPLLSRVKEKHKGNSTLIQQETMKLYKDHGVNPALGCLPLIVQLPIIWALYSVLQHVVELPSDKVVVAINKIAYSDFLRLAKPWDTQFFGLPLGQKPSELLHTVGPAILLVPILTGVLQLVQSKMMMGSQTTKVVVKETGKALKKPDIAVKQDDFASAFQAQSLFIFPFMIGFFSYTFPIGLSLYWNTFTIFGILQQYLVAGTGGLSDWLAKIKK